MDKTKSINNLPPCFFFLGGGRGNCIPYLFSPRRRIPVYDKWNRWKVFHHQLFAALVIRYYTFCQLRIVLQSLFDGSDTASITEYYPFAYCVYQNDKSATWQLNDSGKTKVELKEKFYQRFVPIFKTTLSWRHPPS